MKSAASFLFGTVFAVGLGVSGLVRPEIIRGALDVTGKFNASLFISFACALLLYAPLARLAQRRATLCHLPTARRIDSRLLAGSALFGIGWGLAGTCPGPAVLWLVTLGGRALVFMVAMLLGMALFSITKKEKQEA